MDEAGDTIEVLKNADLHSHSMAKYFDDIIVQWQYSDEIPEGASTQAPYTSGKEEQVIRTGAPKIFSAVWYAEQKKVTIIGDDLELIVEARVDGVVWNHELEKERPRAVQLTQRSTASGENENRRPDEVQLVTCFGEAKHRVRTQYAPVSVTWPNSCVAEAHKRCSLKLCFMIKHAPADEVEKYEEEWKLLRLSRDEFELKTRDLGWLVSQVWPPAVNLVLRKYLSGRIELSVPTTIEVTDNMRAYVERGTAVLGYSAVISVGVMTSPLVLFHGISTFLPVVLVQAGALVAASLGVNYINRIHRRPTVTPTPLQEVKIAILQTVERAFLPLKIISTSWKALLAVFKAESTWEPRTVNNYMDVLHLTSLVLGLRIPRAAINDERQISQLEQMIYDKFKTVRSSMTDLRDSIARCNSINSLDRAAHVSGEDYEGPDAIIAMTSMTGCIDRAEFIHDVLHADDLLREKVKVVLVVGPQNAGKSALINCILGEESARTGYRVHTEDLERYHATRVRGHGQVVLVDSPGMDSDDSQASDVKAAWQDMEGVPDLVIMVVLFQGDINESAQQLAESITKWTKCRNQMLVLNKCDQILSDESCLSEFTPQAMADMRSAFAHTANLEPQNVIMTVLLAQRYSVFGDVLEERGVQLREEATRTLMDRIEHINGYEGLQGEEIDMNHHAGEEIHMNHAG